MAIPEGLLSPLIEFLVSLLSVGALLLAVFRAPWGALRESGNQHVFLGSCVAVAVLWHIEASAGPGLGFHLLGMTTLTLMFGWSLAVVAATIVTLALTLQDGQSWSAFALVLMLTGVLPVTLSHWVALGVRSFLPRHLFVFIFLGAFASGGLTAAVVAYTQAIILAVAGVYAYAYLEAAYLPFVPLYAFPEAMLNGMLITVLVVMRPAWVWTYDEDLYLGR